MALTDVSHPTDIAMLTDLYELTMAQGLWENGKENEQGCFTAFYRDHPFGSEYAVMCGTAELAELVVPVNKTTNLPMAYGSGQSVTSEYLWIPSYSEVVGPLDSSNRRYGIYQSEGDQYQLYTDSGVTSVGDNATLALGEYWWTRSPDVVTDYWYLVVSPEGGTPYGHRTGTSDAIVLGFCL